MSGVDDDLVLGPIVGVVLQQLYEAIKDGGKKTKKFDVVLTNLKNTVTAVAPKIKEIDRLNQEPDNLLKEEIRGQLEEGKELVSVWSEIPEWNKIKKHRYAKKLTELDASLCRLLNVDESVQIEQTVEIHMQSFKQTENVVESQADQQTLDFQIQLSKLSENDDLSQATQRVDIKILSSEAEEINKMLDRINLQKNNSSEIEDNYKPNQTEFAGESSSNPGQSSDHDGYSKKPSLKFRYSIKEKKSERDGTFETVYKFYYH